MIARGQRLAMNVTKALPPHNLHYNLAIHMTNAENA
jgi:hypothetical protein